MAVGWVVSKAAAKVVEWVVLLVGLMVVVKAAEKAVVWVVWSVVVTAVVMVVVMVDPRVAQLVLSWAR